MFSLREDINYHEYHINIALIFYSQISGCLFLNTENTE